MASPVRLLHRVQVVLSLLHLAILIIQEQSMKFPVPLSSLVQRRFTCEFLSPFWQFRQRVSLCQFIVLILIRVFDFCWVLATSFLVLPHSYSLLGVAGCSVGVKVSCDEDVGEVGEDEVEELVDRQGTTNGTSFSV